MNKILLTIVLILAMMPAFALAQDYEPEEWEDIAPTAAQPTPIGRAAYLPDISVVANVIGTFTGEEATKGRNNLNVEEIELVFQSAIYPNVRADVVIALADEDDHVATLEEGFLTFTRLGVDGLGSRVGRIRAPFGKVNPIHPHHRLYADEPAVISALFGDLIIQGGNVSYMLPLGNTFVNFELGRYRPTGVDPDDEEPLEGLGVDNVLTLGRLWTGRAIGAQGELELGFSGAQGHGYRFFGDEDRSRITATGIDLTYRQWPGPFSRLLLQSELISHRTSGGGLSSTSQGYYVTAAYKADQYWEYGARYDRTGFPAPIEGTESGWTAFVTRYLNETTFIRGQIKQSNSPELGSVNQALVQLVWGMGPHSHPIQ